MGFHKMLRVRLGYSNRGDIREIRVDPFWAFAMSQGELTARMATVKSDRDKEP